MLERCFGGKQVCTWAVKYESVFCSLGIHKSLPAVFTTFFYTFSYIFHNLIFRLLVDISFWYFPCGDSQLIPVIAYSTSMLRNGSNSFACDWNSVKYSSCYYFLPPDSLWNTMTRPALSPNARYRPVWSNLITDMISS
jgi:hypothetical protein